MPKKAITLTPDLIRRYARQLREQGIIGGVTTTTLIPQAEATRAQMATMLMRFIGVMA